MRLDPADRAFLAGVHPEVVAGVAPWLPRLAAAVGRAIHPTRAGAGEPDGVDGLTRRGPPTRLLPTSLALADAAPDEFLRRAAEGELAYLRTAWRPPPGGWKGLVWLDVGPGTLGAVRWLGLAMATVLARRIRAAGGEPWVAWGPGEDGGPGASLSPLTRALDLAPWFEARTARHATEGEGRALRADPRGPFALRWAVGGHVHGEAARKAGYRVIQAREDLSDGQLRVRAESAEGSRLVRLELPPPAAGVRLLHDLEADGEAAVDRGGPLRIGWVRGGGHLLVGREGAGVAVSFDALRAGAPVTEDLPGEGPLLAATLHEGGPVALRRRGPVVQVVGLDHRPVWRGAPTSLPLDASFTLDETGLPELHVLPEAVGGDGTARAAAVVRDGGGTLWLLDVLGGRCRPLARDVLLLRPAGASDADSVPVLFEVVERPRREGAPAVLWAAMVDDQGLRARVRLDGARTPEALPVVRDVARVPGGQVQDHAAWVPLGTQGYDHLLADAAGRWWAYRASHGAPVLERQPRPVLERPEGTVLLGREDGVVLLAPDRRRLVLSDGGGSRALVQLPGPVAEGPRGLRAALHPDRRHLALALQDGALALVDLEGPGRVLQVVSLPVDA